MRCFWASTSTTPCMPIRTCSTCDGGSYLGLGRNFSRKSSSPGLPTPGRPVSVPSYSYRKASGSALRIRLTRSALSFSCLRLRSNSAGSFTKRSMRPYSAWRCSRFNGWSLFATTSANHGVARFHHEFGLRTGRRFLALAAHVFRALVVTLDFVVDGAPHQFTRRDRRQPLRHAPRTHDGGQAPPAAVAKAVRSRIGFMGSSTTPLPRLDEKRGRDVV